MTHDSFQQIRFNMIEQQIRPWGVLDARILDLLLHVPREQFVPAAYQALSFADTQIPLNANAKMWEPKIEARVLQELAVKPSDHVLEIGTGSGYLTALLAKLAHSVDSVEIDPALAESAKTRLHEHHIPNATVQVGDGARQWGSNTYDVIVLTASLPVAPEDYFKQLAPGGRLFAIVGDAPRMNATLYTLTHSGTINELIDFETVIEPMQNAPQPERFVF